MSRNNITTTEYHIKAGINATLTFAFVSDLHDYPNEPIMETIKLYDVDAILVGGDFIHNSEKRGRGYEFLRMASSVALTFCAVGNHERSYEDDLILSVTRAGAFLLDDAAIQFKDINIGGLSSAPKSEDDTKPLPNIEWLKVYSQIAGYKILICHHPEYYEKYIQSFPIDLILSGHAHGGQWRFFGHGVFAPGQGFFPKYTSGIYDGRLIVSRGIGNQSGVPRINNKPEVVILHLE